MPAPHLKFNNNKQKAFIFRFKIMIKIRSKLTATNFIKLYGRNLHFGVIRLILYPGTHFHPILIFESRLLAGLCRVGFKTYLQRLYKSKNVCKGQ